MQIEIAVLSKPGGRERNEDACGYWTSEDACCWVLSDGLGGHGGGDIASKLVVSTILHGFAAKPLVDGVNVTKLLDQANSTVLQEQKAQPRFGDMRATAVVLAIDSKNASAIWGHVGDSRLYCYRSGQLAVQTRDHSVLQGLADACKIDSESLRGNPQRNVLLSAVGSDEEYRPTVSEQPMLIRADDVFLLCSDGLWEYVDESMMLRMLAASSTLQEWLVKMETELLQRASKGHDNYSALAVRLSEDCSGNP